MMSVLRLMGRRAASFVSKVLGMLKIVMNTAPQLRLTTLDVWRTLVDAVGMNTTGLFLSQMVRTLLPYVSKEINEDTADTTDGVSSCIVGFLSYLLIDHRESSRSFFQDLPVLPDVAALAVLNGSIKAELRALTVLERLKLLMSARNLGHESAEVRAGALEQLHSLFIEHRVELDGYSLDGSYAELITDLTAHLLRLCTDPSLTSIAYSVSVLGSWGPSTLVTSLWSFSLPLPVVMWTRWSSVASFSSLCWFAPSKLHSFRSPRPLYVQRAGDPPSDEM